MSCTRPTGSRKIDKTDADTTSRSHSSNENGSQGLVTIKRLMVFSRTRLIRSGRRADPSKRTKAYQNWNCYRNTSRDLCLNSPTKRPSIQREYRNRRRSNRRQLYKRSQSYYDESWQKELSGTGRWPDCINDYRKNGHVGNDGGRQPTNTWSGKQGIWEHRPIA